MRLDVLVADQDVKLARLYCRFLEENGLGARPISGGPECLALARQAPSAALVLDRELRWPAGVVACLREAGLSVPVILTTWNASPRCLRQLVTPPIVRRLRKFFPLPVLLHAVQQAATSNGSAATTLGVGVASSPRPRVP